MPKDLIKFPFFKLFLVIAVPAFLLSGCAQEKDEIIVNNPEGLYAESISLLNEEKYEQAAKNFEAIEGEVPTSNVALNSNMLRSYAYYMNDKFDDSIFAAEDFIKQYPRNENVSYMYYLKAMCHYKQMVDVDRDQKITLETIGAMQEVVRRFPNTKYAKDAIWKIDYAHNALAGKEMSVGRTYLASNNTVAAVNRFKTVLMNYDTTIFVPEALYRMVEVYESWGVKDQSLYYASILGHNYPNSVWYERAYELVKDHQDK